MKILLLTRVLPGLTLLCLLSPAVVRLFAQATAVAQISGVVTDPQGAVVPGARVEATQISTGFARAAVTGPDGAYILPNLAVGPYELEVSAEGFKRYVRRGIVLQVNTNPAIDVPLQVGAVTQTIEVSANTGMVETQSTGVSQVIDERRVVDLPLNGRQPTQLILLSGAAITAPPSDVKSSKNYPTSTTIAVAGGQANGTHYLMDGGQHDDAFGNINLPLPFPDALQEFSVQTSSIPAQYGQSAGAVVNVVTKSGSNDFHGDLFEFIRNGVTNARNLFAASRDTLKRNQFGGVAGGPVRKQKLFFFGGYQGTRTRTAPPTSTSFVPTAAALSGDFATLDSGACGKARTLIDPTTGQPFSKNFINPSRFNSSALALVSKFVPTSSDPCGKLLIGIPNPQDEDQIIGRIDWIRNSRHTLNGRYFFADFRNPAVFDGKNILLTNRPGVLDRAQSVVLGDTYTLAGSTLNSLHVTWTRDRINRGPASNLPSAADIGLNIAPSTGNFPNISVGSHFSTVCGICSHAHIANDQTQVADDVSLVRGRHQIEFGANYIRKELNFRVTTQEQGSYAFDGSFAGDQLADFLLGLPQNFIQGNATRYNPRQNYFAVYALDNFRVSSRLTLSGGLRWEPYLPEYDIFGRATHFNHDSFVAGQHSGVFLNAPPGVFFPGDPGIPDAGAYNHLADFAPRLGLIWSPEGKGQMTVRASYGVFYDLPDMQHFDRYGFGPPWASTITIFSPAGGFTNPYQGFPGGDPFPGPFPPKADAFFPPGGQFADNPLNIHPPYTQQWNLSIQRQVGPDWLFSVAYMGNKSTHRWVNQELNPAIFIPGMCGSRPCSTIANTNQRRVLSLQNPAGAALISNITHDDDGVNAEYNGVILSANHRLNQHFSVLANYTWSHCIDEGTFSSELSGNGYQNPSDRNADRKNCVTDIRQIFNTSLVVTSPQFSTPMAQRFLGDWELAGIITKRTGFWFGPGSGKDNSLTAVGADRPNLVGDPKLSNPTLAQWFNTAAFQPNAPGTYGNAGANSLVGPGAFTFDVALMRLFHIRGDRHTLEVRAEAFNIFNHPAFDNPVTNLNSASFGQILSATDPRILQGAVKYRF